MSQTGADSMAKEAKVNDDIEFVKHNLIKDITNRLTTFSMNTCISGFMEATNKLIDINKKDGGIDKETLKTISILIAPFAPHMAEELYSMMGGKESVYKETWPKYDESKMKSSKMKLPIQVNGKTNGFVEVPVDIEEKEILRLAKEEVKSKITGEIVKEIYVKNKIINFVAK